MTRALAFIIVIVTIAAACAGCASTGATPRPFPTPNAPSPVTTAPRPATTPALAAGNTAGYGVAGTALSLRGAPYRNGGSDPAGFDCSGFVRYVFSQHGVTVPRTVSELFRAGRQIADDQVQPGDLVFFATVAPGASHVGVAIGGDR